MSAAPDGSSARSPRDADFRRTGPALRAQLYAALHQGNPGDLDYYVEFCRGADSVLELGCGFGRLTCPLTQHCDVVGVDNDPAILALARQRAQSLTAKRSSALTLMVGDIRNLQLDRRFNRVLLPFNTLLCMLTPDDLRNCLRVVANHLSPLGRAALDVYSMDSMRDDGPEAGEDEFEPLGDVQLDGEVFVVEERNRWNRPEQRLDAIYRYTSRTSALQHVQEVPGRYVLLAQLEAEAAEAGLKFTSVFGDFAGNPAMTDAERFVIELALQPETDSAPK